MRCGRRRLSGQGSIPVCLDEVSWWCTDDLWFLGEALVSVAPTESVIWASDGC
jgi:hypothetical protein